MGQNAFCNLIGAFFSPEKLIQKTGLPIKDCLERGEIDVFVTKKPSEFGFANLVAPKTEDLPDDVLQLDWLAQTLAQYYPIMKECGVEEFEITVVIDYEGILNWWISAENMKVFSDLNIAVCLTAYRKEEEELAETEEAQTQ
jgi:hypothetical protein